jgi:D-alanyl-D-alanine carboxypeptidase/D-alanyl-D-alanine-endopeptidase (penicillin-binding protein 4)
MSICKRLNFAPRLSQWLVLATLCVGLLAARAHAGGNIDAQVAEMIQSADLRQTTVGLMAMDVRSGETIVLVNPDEPMIPASNMKLVTTAAALDLLGPDHRFETELRLINADADAAKLVIIGDGDPALGDPKLLRQQGQDAPMLLDRWIDAATGSGVRRIKSITVDDRIFDRKFVHPDWPVDQLNRWYCAEVAGLNFHDNCLDLYPQPTVRGRAPLVRMLPEAPFMEVTNRAATGKTDTFWISRQRNTNVITYRGKVKTARTKPIHVTIHDPPLFLAQLLAHRFRLAGIEVDAVRRVGLDEELPDGRTLARVVTPLATVLKRCNKDSQNLFAEALLKRVGHEFTGSAGSWSNGSAAVRHFLGARLGARAAAISIADGSGMSRQNRVSARLLVELLAAIHEDQRVGPLFLSSLSVGGQDGTLKRRFVKDMNGSVHGKSGYIRGVSCLSGYLVFDQQGEDQPTRVIAFAMLFNGIKAPVYPYQVKHIQNKLVRLLDEFVADPVAARMGG